MIGREKLNKEMGGVVLNEEEYRVRALEREIEQVKREMAEYEVDVEEWEESYRDALNEGGPVYVGGMAFYPADVLEEMDPTAYRCGLVDYVDEVEVEEDAGYMELMEKAEELEAELEEARERLEETEEEEE